MGMGHTDQNPSSKGGNIEETKVKKRNHQGHIDQGLIVSLRITNYKIHGSSVLGYNDFDFFDKMEPPRPLMVAKLNSKTHF
jgi:hypothetical protein